MFNNKKNNEDYSFPSRSVKKDKISNREKQEGKDLIQALKQQVHKDPKNKDLYYTVLNEAQALAKNDMLDDEEIARIDLRLTQILLPVEEIEVSEEKSASSPIQIPQAKIVVPAHVVNTSDTSQPIQENKNDKSGGDIANQDQPQSLYPTLNFAGYTSTNKDISSLFIPKIQTVEIDPKMILNKEIDAFAKQLQNGIARIQKAIADKEFEGIKLSNKNVLVFQARLEMVLKVNKAFDQFKSKIDDNQKLQRYRDLFGNALKFKPSTISTNKSSFVTELADKNEQAKPVAPVKKQEKLKLAV